MSSLILSFYTQFLFDCKKEMTFSYHKIYFVSLEIVIEISINEGKKINKMNEGCPQN